MSLNKNWDKIKGETIDEFIKGKRSLQNICSK